MSASNWISAIYAFEEPAKPSSALRFTGVTLAVIVGAYRFRETGGLLPLLLASAFASLLLHPRSARAIHEIITRLIHFIFQTLNILLLTIVFLVILTPIGLLRRLTGSGGAFVKSRNEPTIEPAGPENCRFERMF